VRTATSARKRVPIFGRGRISLKTLGVRVFQKITDHGVFNSAASLSYYFVFSLFPFLFFLATVTAYLPILSSSMTEVLDAARGVLPRAAMDLIDQHLRTQAANSRPKLMTLGLLVTLYSASRGVDGIRAALNLAYDVKESRPLWKTEALAFGMTIGGGLLILLSVSMLVTGGDLGFWLARHLGIDSVYVFAWHWARWPVTVLLVMLLAALVYYVLPDVEQEFRFITPGSVLGTLVSLGATLVFSPYAAHFGSYNVTYGSIGGVIILMTWFYISGLIYLVGGEINAVVEHQSLEGKREGARASGEAPPPARERPSAAPVGAASSSTAAARSPGGVVGSAQR
jgi:membrane protein